MSFDYSIKPCSSAKPVIDSDPTSSTFGEVLQPIRYNGVGCPAVILSTNNMVCKNGDIWNINSARAPCNERITKNTCTTTDYNQNVCEWDDDNSICKTQKLSTQNDINLHTGDAVFIEDILPTLEKILNNNSMHAFLSMNPRLISELANITKGCGSSSGARVKGRIGFITTNSFGNGRIVLADTELYLNSENYSEWPSEIFWVELFNGDEIGLEKFNVGMKVNNMKYEENIPGNGTEWGLNLDLATIFDNRVLFPVLRNQVTNLQTRMSVQKTSTINRSQIMNTPRFRRTGSCGKGSLCLDTTLTPSFKNSTKNMYLAPIPYGQRLGNTFRSSQLRGTKKIVRKNCVDPQFGRLVGTGGARLVNKF